MKITLDYRFNLTHQGVHLFYLLFVDFSALERLEHAPHRFWSWLNGVPVAHLIAHVLFLLAPISLLLVKHFARIISSCGEIIVLKFNYKRE